MPKRNVKYTLLTWNISVVRESISSQGIFVGKTLSRRKEFVVYEGVEFTMKTEVLKVNNTYCRFLGVPDAGLDMTGRGKAIKKFVETSYKKSYTDLASFLTTFTAKDVIITY